MSDHDSKYNKLLKELDRIHEWSWGPVGNAIGMLLKRHGVQSKKVKNLISLHKGPTSSVTTDSRGAVPSQPQKKCTAKIRIILPKTKKHNHNGKAF